MRIVSFLFLAALGASAAVSAAADTPPPPASKPQGVASAAPKPSELDRVICKAKEQINTRFPGKKECHSKRWWEEQANLYRQDMDANMSHQHGIDQH
ncbi:MAG TPA: hypothetical protein VGL66_10040 [Caulobacteraceae bacterium]|jgi:hypothetical protein